jgi:hypothetical protein
VSVGGIQIRPRGVATGIIHDRQQYVGGAGLADDLVALAGQQMDDADARWGEHLGEYGSGIRGLATVCPREALLVKAPAGKQRPV